MYNSRQDHIILVQIHNGHTSARKFFNSSNANSYDYVARFATFGHDLVWKREMLRAIYDKNNYNSVLELACGTGILSLMISKLGKSVTGLDLTHAYLAAAMCRLELPLAQGTAEVLPFRNESFDAIMSSYLSKYVDAYKVAEECRRVLRKDGMVIFHDFAYPKSLTMRSLWNRYFSILRLAGRFMVSWKTVFEELDDIIRKSDWISQTEDALLKAGFRNISCKYFTGGTAAIITATKS
jgi:demethylmenaquinone methyltransferase / 2-methoxy-6-polyprenyl-1,4-benzoquinol methylase